MDIEKLKKMKEKLNNKINRNLATWKPTGGKEVVRILPYKFNKDLPIVPLHWHWGVGKRSYLCLRNNFNENCPICEFATELYRGEDKEDKELAKKLFAKIRFYAPVVVRGKENEGPKWWGFGQQVFDAITGYLDDGVGDFTDPETGRDLIVEYQTPEESKNKYGKISVRFKLESTPLTEDNELKKKLIENQKEIFELFPKSEYDEVNKGLQNWINPSEEDETEDNESEDNESDMDIESALDDIINN